MSTTDTYKTIKSSSLAIFKDRGSKFIGLVFRVRTIEDVQSSLDAVKKEYRDARHHCYAYKIGLNNDLWRVNDDGEPSGTAGKPIIGQINSFEITNVLIVVVRYFGGTLLGVGGLINAYRNAARDALQNNVIISEIISISYDIFFPYSAMNDVMTLIKDEKLHQSKQVFELDCSLRLRFRKSLEEIVLHKMSKIEGLKVEVVDIN